MKIKVEESYFGHSFPEGVFVTKLSSNVGILV